MTGPTPQPVPKASHQLRVTSRKAVAAGVFAAAGALGASMLDGTATTAELVVAAGTGLLAARATWAVANEVAA